mgnify:FL=1
MDDWSSFRTTTSEQQRLRAALSGFCESQDLPEEQRAAYTAYLRKRIRPAVEMLIREDDFSKLERILQTGWLSDADRKRFLNLAADQQKWQAFRILLNRSSQDPMQENTESRKTEAAFQKEKPTKEKEALALRLFEEARKNLCWLYPELGEAILFFQHQPSDRTKTITSDGHTIYFNSDFVLRMCTENSSFLKEGYQHLLLECIRRFGKETPEPEKEEQSPVPWLMPEKEEQSPVPWLMPEKEKQFPVSWLVPGKEPELIESFQPVWKRVARKLAENYGTGGLRRGRNRGGKKETLSGIEKRAYDYRRFLKRFTVTREEMELDLDSFDPVAYHYGLMYYGNFPFIEPPETREGNRLEELVIAIDTSGSCKKEIVAKFLGETRSILEEKENFFSRWNVCLIQCDSFVQDVTMIHSPKEWEAYRETITIKGRGGTDFRPVFRKVEELRKQHVFRNLKALIYFTDGDGIYPEQKPDYETAFVFVRQTEKMKLVPKWAKKLLTEECTL